MLASVYVVLIYGAGSKSRPVRNTRDERFAL